MASNTVPTTPTTQRPHQEQIRLLRRVTTRIGLMGIEVVTVTPDRSIPDHWSQVQYRIPLHSDGEACAHTTGTCDAAAITTVRLDEEIRTGEWTWFGGQHCLVGYRRTGSSDTEKALRAKLMKAFGERDEARAERDQITDNWTAAQERRGKVRESLRRYRKTAAAAEDRYDIAFHTAWAGWSSAILLALLVISGVFG